MDVLAANTPKDFILQFDVGTCVEAGADPIAWIKVNPGRIRECPLQGLGRGAGSDRGYRTLFGEGDSRGRRFSKRRIPWEASNTT